MDGDDERQLLERFSAGEISVDDLARIAPSCRCENAAAVVGGHGRVGDEERLRLFLASRSDIDLKEGGSTSLANLLKKRPFRPVSVKKAFSVGLSVYRVQYAGPDELNYAAQILYENQHERNGELGGILAVIDFPASVVRASAAGGPAMCVLDTPLDRVAPAAFKRPSHADVVNSVPGMTEEQLLAARTVLHNSIQRGGTKIDAEAVRDCDLSQFLPKVAAIQ